MGAGAAGPVGAHSPGTAATEPAPAAAPLTPEPASPRVGGGLRIGTVKHYYEHANACVVALEAGSLAVGDTIHVRGHTTDYYQRVARLERNHVPVQSAHPGEEIGLQVDQRVRENDGVYKLSS